MMLFVAVVSVLSAAPAPVPLPDVPVPFGRLDGAVGEKLTGGLPGDETVIEYQPKGCEKTISLNLTRVVGGVSDALRELQQWQEKTPTLEKQLFASKGRLADVVTRHTDAKFEAKKACVAPKLTNGFALTLPTAPKLCEVKGARTGPGDYWFTSAGKPHAVVQVSDAAEGAKDVCLPRLSVLFFDGKGATRLRYQADFNAAVAVTLVGDKCQVVAFTHDSEQAVFHATRERCTK